MLSKHGGNLGEPGSVAYLFDKKGVVVVDARALHRGRPDGRDRRRRRGHPEDEDVFEVLCEPTDLPTVRAALTEARHRGRGGGGRRSVRRRASPLDEDGAVKLMRLIDALEDNDDVDAVHANFDVDAEVLERVAGCTGY